MNPPYAMPYDCPYQIMFYTQKHPKEISFGCSFVMEKNYFLTLLSRRFSWAICLGVASLHRCVTV